MTSANKPPATDDTTPIPPRYWWLKRILLAVGVLILALAVLRWWWGVEAERRLQAKIDEYHALGQPVTIEDFQYPSVPDEENAAHFLQQAAAAIVVPADVRVELRDVCSELDRVVEYVDDVRRIVEANDEVVRLVREAVARQDVDWKVKFRTPIINVILPDLSSQRNLARFLGATTLYNHQTGNDAEAVGLLRNALRQAELVPECQPSLISHLKEIASQALATGVVEEITSGLRIAGSTAEESDGVVPVEADEVRALIDDLLQDDTLRDHWLQAMYAERLTMLDCAMMAAQFPAWFAGAGGGGPPLSRLGGFIKPMFQLDAVFMMEFCTAVADAGAQTNYPTAREYLPRYPSFGGGIERKTHFVGNILLAFCERAVQLHFRLIAERRLAAIDLAIRLYEVDRGHRPALLTDLVPDYLAAVPIDPLDANGHPLRYLPDAPKPILYSVGLDGVDDGGAYFVDKEGSVDRDSKDNVFFLNGDRPRSPFEPSTTQPSLFETVEDDGEEVGDGGNPDEDQTDDDEP